jgi:hypothetical protein
MDKLQLIVVVNGQPASVAANPHAPLNTIIEPALHETHNVGQGPNEWEIRDASGIVLSPDKKISEFGFAPGTRLFLNLKAGVGGA